MRSSPLATAAFEAPHLCGDRVPGAAQGAVPRRLCFWLQAGWALHGWTPTLRLAVGELPCEHLGSRNPEPIQ